jgi:hypothetical protein
METAMLSHRIVPASAVLLAVTIGSAAAQEQTSVGKPLQLLQFARHDARPPAHHRARTVEKLIKHAEVRRHIAKRTVARHHMMFAAVHSHAVHAHRVAEAVPVPPPAAAQARPAASPATMWPAADAAQPGSIAVPAPQAAAQNVKTEPVVSDATNAIAADAIATNGQVAQVAPQPQANPPAVAADAHPAAAEPAPVQSAAAAPAVRAMIVSPAPAESTAKSPIGSAPWLLQVLAALGGALAAGALAGFLILRGRSVPRDEEFFAETLAPGE